MSLTSHQISGQAAVAKSRDLGWMEKRSERPTAAGSPWPQRKQWFLVILSTAHAAQPSLRPKA